jgi:hypothetical protein
MYPLVAGTIARSLGQICDVLNELPDSARPHDLAARARAYARLLDGWTRMPPTDGQQEALLDCVMALHAEVVRSSGTYLVGAGVAGEGSVVDMSDTDASLARTGSSA